MWNLLIHCLNTMHLLITIVSDIAGRGRLHDCVRLGAEPLAQDPPAVPPQSLLLPERCLALQQNGRNEGDEEKRAGDSAAVVGLQ